MFVVCNGDWPRSSTILIVTIFIALVESCTYNFDQFEPRDEPDGSPSDGDVDEANDADDEDADDADDADDDLLPLEPPTLRFPWLGYATGSPHGNTLPSGSSSLRPRFIWEPVEGARSYTFQADRGCSIDDYERCDFPETPDLSVDGVMVDDFVLTEPLEAPLILSDDQPVGARYYWRVKACRGAECSSWSEIRYLDVGRLTNDYDGDGYSDPLVGASHQSNPEPEEGVVYAYSGAPRATLEDSGFDVVRLESPDAEEHSDHGLAVSGVGDLDGDGVSDAVVGAYRHDGVNEEDEDEGLITVYRGAAGVGLQQFEGLSITSPGAAHEGGFGNSIGAAGDTDGDGLADFVVGSYGLGEVYVYHGSNSGSAELMSNLTLSENDTIKYGAFMSLAGVGDVNGDGYPDVVVGDEDAMVSFEESGVAFLYYGSRDGINKLRTREILENPFPHNQRHAHFGRGVAGACDVNSDGFADFLVAAYRQWDGDVNSGMVALYLGSRNGPTLHPDFLESPQPQDDAYFGHAVACADLDGDGMAEVLIGSPALDRAEVDQGEVFIFQWSGDSHPLDYVDSLENLDPQSPNRGACDNYRIEGDAYGYSLAATTDVDGDGFSDVVVGARYRYDTSPCRGEALLHFGNSETGIVEHIRLIDPADPQPGQFGVAVALLTWTVGLDRALMM